MSNRRAGWVVVAVLVGALTCGALVAVVRLSGSGSPSPGVAPAAAEPAARRSSCADVLVVGVDGNDERAADGATFGPSVARYAESYRRAIGTGRTVDTLRLALPTPGLSTLTARHRDRPTVAASIRKASLRQWLRTVDEGTSALTSKVAAAAAACPEQQLVLVGFAQGSKVVHAALRAIRAGDYSARVVGAVLISDPSRQVKSVAHHVGDPQARRGLSGIETRLTKPRPDVPPATPTFAVWDVCTAGDLVCAPDRTPLAAAAATARGYHRSSPAVKAVRAPLVDLTRQWPVPDPAVQVASADGGEPIRLELGVDVAATARAGVQWTATSELPPGLTLSPDGVLSGTPTKSGSWTITYTVAGTAPETTAHSGAVTLSVSSSATSVSAGGQVSCSTDGDGIATCAGSNQFGQLGNGTMTASPSPVQVRGTGWTSISTSGSTTCGIKDDGTLWCWGLNKFGQLGVGASGPRPNPQPVAPTDTWKQVDTSWFHTCAVRSDDALFCWGQNLRAQVGTGRTSRMVEKPRRVDGGAGSWASVTTGGYHTCAVGTDGSLWCWGQNTLGQLGNTQPGLHPTATRVGTDGDWVQASASWGHTCAVTATGRLWCWGLNDDGQLGVGDRRDWWRPQAVAPARIWTAVTTGDALTCALDDQGGSWCWGDDLYGQLNSAGGPTTVPQRADADSTLTSIDAGWMHVCALAGATRTCWGSNEVGQLGTAPSGRRTTTGTTGSSVLTEAQVARQHAVLARGARLLRLPLAEQVRREIGDRPAVPAAARAAARRSLSTTVMTFNLLGSNHTAPTGDRPDWPPGRIRSEWAADLVGSRNGSLVGIQEIQPDQVVSLATATGDRFTIWPGNSMGYAGAPQSLMWRTSEWKAVWKSTVTIPFMRNQSRPQPVVRLRNVATGQEVYMLNAHLSPGKMEADRDRGTKLIIKTIKELQPDGLPILLTGDFNEHGEVFCKVVRQTQLVAALGGSSTAEGCSVPARARVDWIFGSKGSFGTVSVDQGTLVRRTTDHAIQDVTFAVQ